MIGAGTLTAGVAVVYAPLDAVRAAIPRHLRAPDGPRHPVLYLFGAHRDVAVEGTRWPGLRYREALVAVPDLRDGGDEVAWIAQMALSSRRAVALGWPYGFPKRYTAVRGMPDPGFDDHRARFAPDADCAVQLDPTRWFRQPYVGRVGRWAPWTRSQMEYLDPQVTPATCELDVPGVSGAGARRGPADAAWIVTARWRLHLPRWSRG